MTPFRSAILLLHNSKFDVGIMKRRGQRISRTASRKLQSLHHYDFRKRLEQVCLPSPTCPDKTHIVMCDESYSTKCCGSCGKIVHGVGASKVVYCSFCNVEQDRDGGPARNIFLKVMNQALKGEPFLTSVSASGRVSQQPQQTLNQGEGVVSNTH